MTDDDAVGEPVERQVVGALGAIGSATLASRVLGFVRDMVVALVFGAGAATDAFFVAFRIPNILRRLLAEGALSTAVIPTFSDYAVNRPRTELVRMCRAVFGAALAALLAATALGVVAAPWIVAAIAPGFEPGQTTLTILLTRVMFPYLVLVGAAALAMGALNAQGRFFAPALGPAALNLGMIAGTLALAGLVKPPILALAWGVLAGGVGQVLVQLPSLARCGLLVAPSAEWGHPAVGRVARLLLPAVFGLASVQVMVFINTLLASLLPVGSISYLYYADRVMEFPLGVFGIALASASLPAMSRQAARGDARGVLETLNLALRLAAFVSVPATVGLILLDRPIVSVLFERGRFGAEDAAATAWALVWFAAGLVGFAGARIVAQAFYALGAAGAAVRVGAVAVAVNVVTAIALMPSMGYAGLAAASSLGAWLNLALLLWNARRRFGPLGGRTLAASAGRTLVASLAPALWCGVNLWATYPAARASVWLHVAWLVYAIVGGALVFWLASALLGCPERRALLGILPRGRTR